MTGERHPMERYLMTTCGLGSDEELRRLGSFLVAHTVMDTHLISVLVDRELGKLGGAGAVSFDRQREITDGISRRTFKDHLRESRSSVPERAAQIAEEVNRGRDAFVHWKHSRFELPRYDGQLVTEEPGFRVCMDAIQEFLLAVPFHNPGWTANP